MNRSLFTRIVRDLSANCPYFQEGCDAVRKAGISALVKSICEDLRKLTSKNSTLFTRKNMGFLKRLPHKIYGFGHTIDGVAGRTKTLTFYVNLPVIMILKRVVAYKSISQPVSNDVKRIRYKQAHEAARKDVERAFDVLKKKWAIVRTPTRSRSLKRITHLMYTCIILHNMIRKEKGKAISPDFYPEEQHREDDPVRSAQDRLRVIREIHDEETHLNLKADLVEHIGIEQMKTNLL
ncbi:putative nuclease HARBI1 isoform X2 [Tanacetum coccineum]